MRGPLPDTGSPHPGPLPGGEGFVPVAGKEQADACAARGRRLSARTGTKGTPVTKGTVEGREGPFVGALVRWFLSVPDDCRLPYLFSVGSLASRPALAKSLGQAPLLRRRLP